MCQAMWVGKDHYWKITVLDVSPASHNAMEACTQGVQLLLLLLCAVSTCWGQPGNPVIMICYGSRCTMVTISYHLLTVVCLSLSPPTNGIISYSDTTLGDGTVATFTCGIGYTLNGDTTRTCGSDGVWSGSAPTCQRKCMERTLYCLFIECIISPIQVTALTYPY